MKRTKTKNGYTYDLWQRPSTQGKVIKNKRSDKTFKPYGNGDKDTADLANVARKSRFLKSNPKAYVPNFGVAEQQQIDKHHIPTNVKLKPQPHSNNITELMEIINSKLDEDELNLIYHEILKMKPTDLMLMKKALFNDASINSIYLLNKIDPKAEPPKRKQHRALTPQEMELVEKPRHIIDEGKHDEDRGLFPLLQFEPSPGTPVYESMENKKLNDRKEKKNKKLDLRLDDLIKNSMANMSNDRKKYRELANNAMTEFNRRKQSKENRKLNEDAKQILQHFDKIWQDNPEPLEYFNRTLASNNEEKKENPGEQLAIEDIEDPDNIFGIPVAKKYTGKLTTPAPRPFDTFDYSKTSNHGRDIYDFLVKKYPYSKVSDLEGTPKKTQKKQNSAIANAIRREIQEIRPNYSKQKLSNKGITSLRNILFDLIVDKYGHT